MRVCDCDCCVMWREKVEIMIQETDVRLMGFDDMILSSEDIE